jgi:glutamate 5-kinase
VRKSIPVGGRLVIKVGSSSLASTRGVIDDSAVERVVASIVETHTNGYPTVFVTSGAVAAGMGVLNLDRRPTDLAALQVAAAVGQGRLMERYSAAFARRGLIAGQVLLTKDVLSSREQYLNARSALDRMLVQRIVPVVNENDAVGVEELRFGDNDRLAAIVSHLIGAALLLILTDTPGLFSSDPRLGEAELLGAVRHTDQVLDRLTGNIGPLGSGGAATKVAAARIAAWSGVPTVVASSETEGVVARVLAGEDEGTWVEPRTERLPSRKLWIAFGQPSAGVLVADDGAVEALVHGSRSLLPVGITRISGSFAAGAAVEIHDRRGQLIGKGLSRLDSISLTDLLGKRSDTEAIHRDDLVILVHGSVEAGEPAPRRLPADA